MTQTDQSEEVIETRTYEECLEVLRNFVNICESHHPEAGQVMLQGTGVDLSDPAVAETYARTLMAVSWVLSVLHSKNSSPDSMLRGLSMMISAHPALADDPPHKPEF